MISKLEAMTKINAVLAASKKNVSAAAVNVDSYMDFLESSMSGFEWKSSSWTDRVGLIIQLAGISFDFYKDIIDETEEGKNKAILDITMIGWAWLKTKYNIQVPSILAPFEPKFIQFLVSAAIKAKTRILAEQL